MWEIKCLEASYGKHSVLNNFELQFAASETVALIGKNGSGKSTFVEMILGIVPKFSYELFYNDQEVKSLEAVRSLVGIVFQYPDDQFLGATVAEELFLNCMNQQQTQKKVDQLIELFSLQSWLSLSPFELSGGQKQILAFVITLLSNPKLLILDEATSMLDPESKHEFLQVVMAYQTANAIAIIHITHDFNELYLFDKIAYLEEGSLYFTGSYQEFIEYAITAEDIVLPLNLQIAIRLVEEKRILRIPKTKNEWEELAWVLQSLI